MSVNKIITVFVIILLIFAGLIAYQFSTKKPAPKKLTTSATAVIKNTTFKLKIARTPEEQKKGLTGLNSMAADEGMLFLFEKPQFPAFWMKNVKFPLDIIYINGNKIVSFVEEAKPATAESTPLYFPEGASDKALELNGGTVKKYGIKKGDIVTINQ